MTFSFYCHQGEGYCFCWIIYRLIPQSQTVSEELQGSSHRPCLKSYRAPITDRVWRVTGLQSQTVSEELQGLSSNPDFLPDLCYF